MGRRKNKLPEFKPPSEHVISRHRFQLDHPVPLDCPGCGAELDLVVRGLVPGCTSELMRNRPVTAGIRPQCPRCACTMVVTLGLSAWAEVVPDAVPAAAGAPALRLVKP